jgi:proline iminopeptidase
MFAKIRDTELFFDVEGSALVAEGPRMREKPVAFLVHGGPGADHTGFKPTFGTLSDRLQLVYFDHRGQGRSARGPRSSYTLDNNVADMEALRAYLGLDQIVVIGGSYGGMVAQAYASRYPDRVSQLILMVTVSHGGFLPQAKLNLADRGNAEQQAIAEYLWAGTFRDDAHLAEYFRLLAPLYSLRAAESEAESGPDATPAIRAILSVEPINEAFGGFLRTFDLRSELPRITAPTLVIAGREDWICPPEFSEEIAGLIPQAELHILEDSGHSVRADQPGLLLGAIGQFLDAAPPIVCWGRSKPGLGPDLASHE